MIQVPDIQSPEAATAAKRAMAQGGFLATLGGIAGAGLNALLEILMVFAFVGMAIVGIVIPFMATMVISGFSAVAAVCLHLLAMLHIRRS